MTPRPPPSPLFPYTPLFRSLASRLCEHLELVAYDRPITATIEEQADIAMSLAPDVVVGSSFGAVVALEVIRRREIRSEEHTSELQSQSNLVCRLLLEKKKN